MHPTLVTSQTADLNVGEGRKVRFGDFRDPYQDLTPGRPAGPSPCTVARRSDRVDARHVPRLLARAQPVPNPRRPIRPLS